MIWLRKGFVHLLSTLLLIALLGAALATSANLNLSHPTKIENWLSQSKLYDNFVNTAVTQAQKSTSNNSGSTPLNILAVRQAAASAFSPELLQQSVNTFLDSNYAWLQGKTIQPEFTIDLSSAKQSFAKQVGQYTQAHLAGLPVCTNAQLAQIPNPANVDPLSLTCRPPSLSPAAVNTQVTQKIYGSDGFLSNPVITPQSFQPKGNGGPPSQPYYQKLSMAPKAYRLGQKLPYILGVFSLLCMLGIIFIAPRRRQGLRRVGVVLFEAGILLVVAKFISDYVFKKLEHRVFTSSDVGQLQQSLIDFGHHVQHQIVTNNLYFGVAFLVLAIIIFLILFLTRQHNAKPGVPEASSEESVPLGSETNAPQSQADTVQLAPRRHQPRVLDISRPSTPVEPTQQTPAPQSPSQPSRPKRPRLIQ